MVFVVSTEHRTLRTGRLVRGRRVPGDQTGPSTSLVSSPSRDEGKNACLLLQYCLYCGGALSPDMCPYLFISQ